MVQTASPTFSITVQPSGRQFSVESTETILTAGIRQNIGLPYGCKDGACGSCKCKMITGKVVHGTHQSKALSAEEEANGMILTCCATPESDVILESRQVTEIGALPIKKMPVRVSRLTRASHDVMLLDLQLPGNDSFTFRAGQYVDFLLRDGSRRSYSMANAPHQTGSLQLHLRHMPGGLFTDHVFGNMKEKEILRIEGPQGSFFLREESNKPIVFLASGTGFAPIKAILEHMQHHKIQRPAFLYWGGRRPADLYLHDWVVSLCAGMPQLQYIPVVSDAQTEDGWNGRTGFVHRAVLQDFPDLSNYQVYACGAPVMVEAARNDFVQHAHLPAEEFYADAFTSAADKATK